MSLRWARPLSPICWQQRMSRAGLLHPRELAEAVVVEIVVQERQGLKVGEILDVTQALLVRKLQRCRSSAPSLDSDRSVLSDSS